MPEITVERSEDEGARSRFHVTVAVGEVTSEHEVTLSPGDLERLGRGYGSPELFVRACFGFLLEREPNTSILRSFDVGVISRYFPEFEERISRP